MNIYQLGIPDNEYFVHGTTKAKKQIVITALVVNGHTTYKYYYRAIDNQSFQLFYSNSNSGDLLSPIDLFSI